jgi:hypothetical protein
MSKIVMKEHKNKEIPTLEYTETDTEGNAITVNRYPPNGTNPEQLMTLRNKKYYKKPS